ncbi:hypothetical protein [Pseudomonas graminis]
MAQSFQNLANTLGLELPERLVMLLHIAQTHPSALASLPDFYWIDAAEAEREIDEWLNPTDQPGRRFLPFATSGSGEHYCWVRLEDGASGVAQILHFGQNTPLAHADISNFITSEYVRRATNLDDLPPQTDHAVALANEVTLIRAALLPTDYAFLQALFAMPCVPMSYKDGPKSVAKTVRAFISQEQARQVLEGLRNPRHTEFAALREWMR